MGCGSSGTSPSEIGPTPPLTLNPSTLLPLVMEIGPGNNDNETGNWQTSLDVMLDCRIAGRLNGKINPRDICIPNPYSLLWMHHGSLEYRLQQYASPCVTCAVFKSKRHGVCHWRCRLKTEDVDLSRKQGAFTSVDHSVYNASRWHFSSTRYMVRAARSLWLILWP